MPTTANGAPSFPITGTLKAKSETEASPSEQKKNLRLCLATAAWRGLPSEMGCTGW